MKTLNLHDGLVSAYPCSNIFLEEGMGGKEKKKNPLKFCVENKCVPVPVFTC